MPAAYRSASPSRRDGRSACRENRLHGRTCARGCARNGTPTTGRERRRHVDHEGEWAPRDDLHSVPDVATVPRGRSSPDTVQHGEGKRRADCTSLARAVRPKEQPTCGRSCWAGGGAVLLWACGAQLVGFLAQRPARRCRGVGASGVPEGATAIPVAPTHLGPARVRFHQDSVHGAIAHALVDELVQFEGEGRRDMRPSPASCCSRLRSLVKLIGRSSEDCVRAHWGARLEGQRPGKAAADPAVHRAGTAQASGEVRPLPVEGLRAKSSTLVCCRAADSASG